MIAPLIQLPLSQPKRDPADVRYWTQREGGTGFARNATPRYQYAALRTYDANRHLVTDDTALSSMDVTGQQVTDPRLADYSPDTIRSRARATLLLALQRVSDKLSDPETDITLNELSQSVSALGRISGVQADDVKTGDVRIHIVRDALPSHVQARLIASPADHAAHAQHVSAQHVSDDDAPPSGA